MEIILANDFTHDPYARRAVRLLEIQNNIDRWLEVFQFNSQIHVKKITTGRNS